VDYRQEGKAHPSRASSVCYQELKMPQKNNTPKKSNQGKRWVAKVKTDSTHPPQGLFTKNAVTIARTLASRKVSPKGPGSGMRMLTYFINRGGRGLPRKRRAELEQAKALLSKRIRKEKSAKLAGAA
jgi:uncharacterized protein DUF3175